MISEAKRKWLRKDMVKRKERAIAYLGGHCVYCGTNENLEFDHIHSATKSYNITGNLNRQWEVLILELDKCQLLCSRCHHLKTVENNETGGGWNKNQTGKIPHGTSSGYTYWKCRCEPCKQARYEARVRCGDSKGTRGRYDTSPCSPVE